MDCCSNCSNHRPSNESSMLQRLPFLFKALFWCIILICAFCPNTNYFFGFDIILKHYKLELPNSFNGSLLANRWLSNAEHLFVDEIRGPESFATWNGKVYSGFADGRIVELLEDNYQTVAFVNPHNRQLEECRKPFLAARYCARPLGLKFSSNGTLFAADPYHGIYHINITDGQHWLIMNITKHKLPANRMAKFLDDIAILEEDDGNLIIYMTDVSERWLLHDVYYVVGEHDQTGKLLSFNTRTSQLKTEISNLAFPNGITLMDDKQRILINEFNRRRILAYYINGEREGEVEIFADNLPGEPDNIKRSLNDKLETYLVALFTGRNKERTSFYLDFMSDYPFIKRFYFRITRIIGLIMESFGLLIDNHLIMGIGFDIRVSNFMIPKVSEYGLALELDSMGNIVNSFHSPDGYTSQLSEIFEYNRTATNRYFYLGSYSNPYLGRLITKNTPIRRRNIVTNSNVNENLYKKTIENEKKNVKHRESIIEHQEL